MSTTILPLNVTSSIYANSFCPLNEFCSFEARKFCDDLLLNSCQYCNVSIGYGLLSVYIIMGVAIFAANGLIFTVYIYRYTQNNVSKFDPIRLSLAAADILAGIQIFATVVPQLTRKLSMTGYEQKLLKSKMMMTDSWDCGVFLIFGFSASLYHLILLGFQRLYAITWPWRYESHSLKAVYLCLLFVWLLAIFTAAVPGIFSDYYFYCKRISLCFVCARTTFAYVVLYSTFLFLPFAIMTITSISIAIVARRKIGKSTERSCNEEGRRRLQLQQYNMFKIVAIMQIGFTTTVCPSMIGIVLSMIETPCNFLDRYETACFILFFANSFLNAIVYSVREKKFRDTVIKLCYVIKHAAVCSIGNARQNSEVNSKSNQINNSSAGIRSNAARSGIKLSSFTPTNKD